MGSIIAQKNVKNAAIINALQKAWEGFNAVKIMEATNRVEMFDFTDEETREKIFDMCPWSVQGQCLSIKKWTTNVGLAKFEFRMV